MEIDLSIIVIKKEKENADEKKRLKKKTPLNDYNPEIDEDDIESRTKLLLPSRFTLRLPPQPLKKQFDEEREKKFTKLYVFACFFLASIYLLQSMLLLIVRKQFGFGSGFIALRSCFSAAIIFMILCYKYLERRKVLNRLVLYIILMYGAIVLAVQSQFTSEKSVWFHRITLLELVFLLIIGINSR